MQQRTITEFKKLVNQKEAIITSQVYLELCEIKRYHQVEYYFNSTLNKICVTAQRIKNGPTGVFVPVAINENMNFLKILDILQSLNYETKFLAIVHSDSTCVYYNLTGNLLEPTDTTAKHLKENKQDKLDSDLKKNRKLLEHTALMGLGLTLK